MDATRRLLKESKIFLALTLKTQPGDGYERLPNISLYCSNSDHNVRSAGLLRDNDGVELANFSCNIEVATAVLAAA